MMTRQTLWPWKPALFHLAMIGAGLTLGAGIPDLTDVLAAIHVVF